MYFYEIYRQQITQHRGKAEGRRSMRKKGVRQRTAQYLIPVCVLLLLLMVQATWCATMRVGGGGSVAVQEKEVPLHRHEACDTRTQYVRENGLQGLPIEILQQIFEKLSLSELKPLGLTCKFFYRIFREYLGDAHRKVLGISRSPHQQQNTLSWTRNQLTNSDLSRLFCHYSRLRALRNVQGVVNLISSKMKCENEELSHIIPIPQGQVADVPAKKVLYAFSIVRELFDIRLVPILTSHTLQVSSVLPWLAPVLRDSIERTAILFQRLYQLHERAEIEEELLVRTITQIQEPLHGLSEFLVQMVVFWLFKDENNREAPIPVQEIYNFFTNVYASIVPLLQTNAKLVSLMESANTFAHLSEYKFKERLRKTYKNFYNSLLTAESELSVWAIQNTLRPYNQQLEVLMAEWKVKFKWP